MSDGVIRNHAAFIWSVADMLRGVYKQSEYGRVILPLVVLRRLDCVLEPTKEAVLERAAALKGKVENVEPVLERRRGRAVLQHVAARLPAAARRPGERRRTTCAPTSPASRPAARDVIDKFGFDDADHAARPRRTCSTSSSSQFAEIDLHPETRLEHWRWATSTRS